MQYIARDEVPTEDLLYIKEQCVSLKQKKKEKLRISRYVTKKLFFNKMSFAQFSSVIFFVRANLLRTRINANNLNTDRDEAEPK